MGNFNSVGISKERICEFDGDTNHTVLVINANHFAFAHHFELFALNVDLNNELNNRTRCLVSLRLKINAGGADVAGQALDAVEFDRQPRLKSIGNPLGFDRVSDAA